MADYRLSVSVISRSDARSAVAAASYRSGEELREEQTNTKHDYTRKEGVVYTEMMAPPQTPAWMKDRSQLWNAVETIETHKNAQLARETIELAA